MTSAASDHRETPASDPAVFLNRPIVPLAVALLVGIAVHDRLPVAVTGWVVASLALLLAWSWTRRERLGETMLLLSAASAGVALAQVAHFRYRADHVCAFATEQPRLAWLEIELDRPPRTIVLPLATGRPLPPKQVALARVVGVRTWTGWERARGDVLLQIAEPNPRLAVGQTVRVLGRLERPGPSMNPGQFDWQSYYRDQRVLVSLQVPHARNLQVVRASSPSPLERLRAVARQALAIGFDPKRSLDHALLRALLLGDHDPELRDVQEQFRRTGMSHHLAISGMHVAVLGGLVFLLCRLLRLQPGTAWLAAATFVALYGLVALPSPPVVRSVLLWGIIGLAVLSGRSVDLVQLLAVIIVAMLLVHPLDLFSPGFQLSFGTVLGLMTLSRPMLRVLRGPEDPDLALARRLRRPAFWREFGRRLDAGAMSTLAAALVAWLVSMPLVAFHFEQLNTWAVLGSIVLAPFVFAALVAGLLKVVFTLLLPVLAEPLAGMAAFFVRLMRLVVDELARLPWSDVPLPAPSLELMASCYLALVLALCPWTRPSFRWLTRGALTACLLAVFILPFSLGASRGVAAGTGMGAVAGIDASNGMGAGTGTGASTGMVAANGMNADKGIGTVAASVRQPTGTAGECRITLLAIGAGQCAVIEPPGGRVVLVDAGSQSMSDPLRRAIAPFLRHRGITAVDTLVITHANFDHYGAAAELVENYAVREVLAGPRFAEEATLFPPGAAVLRALESLDRPVRVVCRGQRIPLARDTTLTILHPDQDESFVLNDGSLVLRLEHAGTRVLFTGDIQDAALRALLTDHPDELPADVLLAPHHGSAEPSTPAFLKAVAPRLVIASNDRTLSGRQRQFDRLVGSTPLLRTHSSGAITIRIARDGTWTVRTHLSARR